MSAPVVTGQDRPPLPSDAPAQPVPDDEANGEFEPGPPTRFRLRVIGQHCVDCIHAPEDVSRCVQVDCPLWGFRHGGQPQDDQTEAAALLAVARFCLTVCCDGERKQVLGCSAYDCALWPWRGGQPTMRDGTPVPQAQEGTWAPDMAPVERACLHAGQTVERLCPDCGGVPLPPRRRKCDRCRREARREAWRKEKRRQRNAARVPCPTRDDSRCP